MRSADLVTVDFTSAASIAFGPSRRTDLGLQVDQRTPDHLAERGVTAHVAETTEAVVRRR